MAEEHAAQAETRSILTECGALLLEDHFVYSFGHHGPGWIAEDLVNIDAAGLSVEHFTYLDEVLLPSRPADSCSLCVEQVPVNPRFAHGAAFVEAARG